MNCRFVLLSICCILFSMYERSICENDNNLSSLEIKRELDKTQSAYHHHHHHIQLTLHRVKIEKLTSQFLETHGTNFEDLAFIEAKDLKEFDHNCFDGIPNLRSLYIWNAPKLEELPLKSLNTVPTNLHTIRIIYSGLKSVPDLTSLYAPENSLQMLDFDHNKIEVIKSRSIKVTVNQLILDFNQISEIQEYAFEGSRFSELSLRGNSNLKHLNPLSFAGIVEIFELIVSGTSIISLPSIGLETVEILRAEENLYMKTIPSIYDLKKLRQAYLTHHFHCCAFAYPDQHDPDKHAQYMAHIEKLQQSCSGNKRKGRDLSQLTQDTEKSHYFTTGDSSLGSIDTNDEMYGDEFGSFHTNADLHNKSSSKPPDFCGNISKRTPIVCKPRADALNPCTGILGGIGGRIAAWIAGLAATFANFIVAGVMLSRRTSLAPSHLLQLQLAIADLCTAAYLLLLAAIDTYTSGVYFNHAYDWQYGIGCKAAGFLAITGVQTSLCALAALTLERWLAITRALHPQRRLSPRSARILLLASLAYSLIAASLPLFGISDYSSTSICLPMQRKNWIDTTYLSTILLTGVMSLACIIGCYSHIYYTLARDARHCPIKAGEAKIANKMAILIGVHMACCLPVGIAGAGALSGHSIIDVNGAKLLLVLVYPLNSLADPFLYAILTHQFRKDFCLLLARYGICLKRAQHYKIPSMQEEMTEKRIRMRENGQIAKPPRSLTTACEDLLV